MKHADGVFSAAKRLDITFRKHQPTNPLSLSLPLIPYAFDRKLVTGSPSFPTASFCAPSYLPSPTGFLLRPFFLSPCLFFSPTATRWNYRHYRAASRAFVVGDDANRQRNRVSSIYICMCIIRVVYVCVGGEKYRRLCGLSRLVCHSVGLGVSHERSTRLKVRGGGRGGGGYKL